MIFGLFESRFADDTFALYRSIVTEARRPEFYTACGVPDTVTGRFDMVVLMVAVVLHRLRLEPASETPAPKRRRGAPATAPERAQELVDLFFQEMDSALREMGVGDMSMPKRMKKLAHAWNGRTQVYDRALDDGDLEALVAAVSRNVLAEQDDRSGAAPLAAHVLSAARRLTAQPIADVLAGRLDWPTPAVAAPASPEPTP